LIVKFLNIPTCFFLHVLDQLSIRKLPFKSKDDFSEHVLPSSACIVNVYSDLSEQEAFLIVKTDDDPKVQLYLSAYLLILKMMVPFEYTTNNVWLLFTTVISLKVADMFIEHDSVAVSPSYTESGVQDCKGPVNTYYVYHTLIYLHILDMIVF
jgi:hypothetical protein